MQISERLENFIAIFFYIYNIKKQGNSEGMQFLENKSCATHYLTMMKN